MAKLTVLGFADSGNLDTLSTAGPVEEYVLDFTDGASEVTFASSSVGFVRLRTDSFCKVSVSSVANNSPLTENSLTLKAEDGDVLFDVVTSGLTKVRVALKPEV